MFECLYGFTPFACDDRQQTKLKILHHRKTLTFPEGAAPVEPSIEAIDLMMQLLVEKERRLCSRQYQVNDYERKIIGGRVVKVSADKKSPHYEGYFVHAGDAEDIKRHPFLKDIDWDTIHLRRPPYPPNVKDWEDTTYFDEEDPISDIDSASTFDEDDEDAAATPTVDGDVNLNVSPLLAQASSQISQHQHEDQNIVPSLAINMPRKGSATPVPGLSRADSMNDMRNPLLQPPDLPFSGVDERTSPAMDHAGHVDGPDEKAAAENIKPKGKDKDKKRPRDIILRDPSTGREALEIRKMSAFLGYDYRQPAMVKDIVEQVLAEDLEKTRLKDDWHASGPSDRDLAFEKRMFVEAGGHLSSTHKPAML